MTEVHVGAGSNIDAATNLRWAVHALGLHFGALTCSSVYESPAFGFEGPDFLNLVVRFRSDSGVDAVEAVLSELENGRGRDSGERSGSRTLDLDLLLFGARVDARRRLPRADILRYPFVLAPLAEIAPALPHPLTGQRMDQAWAAMAAGVTRLTRLGAPDAA